MNRSLFVGPLLLSYVTDISGRHDGQVFGYANPADLGCHGNHIGQSPQGDCYAVTTVLGAVNGMFWEAARVLLC